MRPLRWVLILIAALAARPAAAADVTGADVARAVEQGVEYLRTHRDQVAGWGAYRSGAVALRALAMVAAGVDPVRDPLLAEDIRSVLADRPTLTYTRALQAMLLTAVDPVAHRAQIRTLADALVAEQQPAGTWTYQRGMNRAGDNSNTQFALLGLYAAQEAGAAVPNDPWERTVKYFSSTQNQDGGWGYVGASASTRSMTAAGVASLLIAQNRLAAARKCGDQPSADRIRAALESVGKTWDNGLRAGFAEQWLYYYMYAVERVGILSGRKYLGGHDWYRDGAEYLVRRQSPDGSWSGGQVVATDTALAILFLAKGHTPLLVNKLEWDGDWNNDPSDLKNLLEFSSRRLNRRFSWQVVSTREPTEELGFAPVLYMNGHTAPKLDDEGLAKLRAFIEGGGLIFAEACCDRPEFDRGFRDLVERLLPGHKLAPLGGDHAIYRVQFRIDNPALQFLEGVSYACRTAVIYSPRDLSCAWDLGCPYQNAVTEEQADELGMNVLLYGMGNVPLRDKLDRKGALSDRTEEVVRDTFVFAQVRHEGDWNPDPHAWTRLREVLDGEQGVRCLANKRAVTLGDPNLSNYPFLYLTGHDAFAFSEAQRKALRQHLDRGGILFAESCCGKAAFDRSVRAELAAVFPDVALKPVPAGDRLRTAPYAVGAGRFLPAAAAGERDLVGIERDGRWLVLYSPVAVLCPVDGHPCPECRAYVPEDGAHLAANIIMYALTQ